MVFTCSYGIDMYKWYLHVYNGIYMYTSIWYLPDYMIFTCILVYGIYMFIWYCHVYILVYGVYMYIVIDSHC